MKKSSFGKRRSSIAGRNTFGGSTFGRQNSFDGIDMRFLFIGLPSSIIRMYGLLKLLLLLFCMA